MPYNQSPSGGAYGDAFIVQTPRFDQARQQLMQEQMQRRMYQQKEATQIDGQLAKQFSRIRSVDTPEVFDSYNQYKNFKKQLLFDPKIRNNPQAYNQVQQQANEALATTFQKADQSARYNQMGRDLFTSYRGHPDRYADNFGEMIGNFNSTPMSKLADHETGDLSDPSTYMYNGANTDFGSLDKIARGNQQVRTSIEEPLDTQGLQTRVTPYSYGNSPAEYYQSMLGSLGKRGAGRDASANWEHLQAANPALVEHVNQEYDKITPDQWKKMTGSEQPQVINPDPTNNADQFAAYQAKVYALNNLPQAGKVSTRNNQAAILGEKNTEREKLQQNTFRQQKVMQQIRNGDAIGRINLHRLYAKQDAAGQNALVDEHFNDEFNEAKKQPPENIPTDSGKPLVGFKVNPIDVIAKEFMGKDEKGHAIKPTEFIISPDGKMMTGVFTKVSPDGKTAMVDDSKTVQKSVDTELKPVFKAFATPKSKVPNLAPPKPKIPVTLHKGIFDDLK
jgi:hypothetical protein